jgi:hypothetical protein
MQTTKTHGSTVGGAGTSAAALNRAAHVSTTRAAKKQRAIAQRRVMDRTFPQTLRGMRAHRRGNIPAELPQMWAAAAL